MDNQEEQCLERWLALFQGPGFRGQKARDQAIAEMQAAGSDRLFPLLRERLADPDPEVRCVAIQAALWIDAPAGQNLVLPLLYDVAAEVRWCVCWCLHDFGDHGAVSLLIDVLEGDENPQIRGAAAYALGGIGSPAAIPALLASLDDDLVTDRLGQSPSASAATALEFILSSAEMRVEKRDHETLRRQAGELYHQWSPARA